MPETISDTRQLLTSHVARFRAEWLDAEPVVFGDHRQPEAALIPYQTFRLLLDVAEDVASAQRLTTCERSSSVRGPSLRRCSGCSCSSTGGPSA